jgi:hypothetical protein
VPKPYRVMNARYKGFCWTCHYTIWLNERIKFDGRAKHLDCLAALHDDTPRVMDERWVAALGMPKKGRVRFVTGQDRVRSTKRTKKAWRGVTQ